MIRFSYIVVALVIVLVEVCGAVDPTAWVINTSGETLSKINLATGVVTNNILPLGSDIESAPNQIVVRDTLAYVAVSATDEIQIIDLKSESTIGFIPTGENTSPFWMSFYDDRYVFATFFEGNALAKIDVEDGTIVGQWPVGLSPEGVIIAGGKAYVAVTAFDPNTWQYGQGTVAVFDIAGDSLLPSIDVGLNPQYVDVDMSGRIHVVCTGNYYSVFGIVYVIDPLTDAVVDSVATGGAPGNVSIGPDNMAYIAAGGWYGDGEMFSYHAGTGEVFHGGTNPITVDSGCMMAVTYQDSSVFVGAFEDFVTRVDSSGSVFDRFAMGDGPVHAGFNYQPGDVDGSFSVDIADLVYLVNWQFRGGPKPPWPSWRANLDANASVDIADVVFMVNYMFQSGSRPQMGCDWYTF